MPQTTSQITVKDLKEMLDESNLSAATKATYSRVLEEMNEEEKAELTRIIEEGHRAEAEYAEYEDQRLDQLARLNEALKKHLQKSLREEEKDIRKEFEELEEKEEEEEMKTLEEEINKL